VGRGGIAQIDRQGSQPTGRFEGLGAAAEREDGLAARGEEPCEGGTDVAAACNEGRHGGTLPDEAPRVGQVHDALRHRVFDARAFGKGDRPQVVIPLRP
jgi:hypothetical protein